MPEPSAPRTAPPGQGGAGRPQRRHHARSLPGARTSGTRSLAARAAESRDIGNWHCEPRTACSPPLDPQPPDRAAAPTPAGPVSAAAPPLWVPAPPLLPLSRVLPPVPVSRVLGCCSPHLGAGPREAGGVVSVTLAPPSASHGFPKDPQPFARTCECSVLQKRATL